jgi:cysteine-rich repeat protein
MMQPGEECDDGNRNSFDECPNSCKLPQCGDELVEGKEQCDDGNQVNDDSCPNTCRLPTCGNNVVEAGEQCDDGNTADDDECSSSCRLEKCGDGVLQPGEECDDGLSNSDTLPNACRLSCRKPICGDRVVDSSEQCDGGDDCTDVCSSVAFFEQYSTVLSAVGAVLFLIIISAGILFRRALSTLFTFSKKVSVPGVSLDDIPLDELEMPWHKWDTKA